ncbi:MAG: phage tail protein [Candidatus Parabeggiatoa sp. nov. 1]|nr:MAG: phage tail protein [Gammaproteobacteria bacterium]
MAEPFMGEIKMVGFDFPPKGWAFCDGKVLNSQQHNSLYSLLGNAFGGDQTNFALPNMQSRFPIGAGQGEELTSYSRGQKGGVENAPLQTDQLPAHSHAAKAKSSAGDSVNPSGKYWAAVPVGRGPTNAYSSSTDTTMNGGAIANTGGGHSHENMPPFLAIYFIIALQGKFPPRN